MMAGLRERIRTVLASPVRQRVARGALWGGVAVAGSRVITVAASVALARTLGQVGFGEYGIVNSTAGMVSSLAGMGLGQTVTKYVGELKNTDRLKLGRILALSSIVTIAGAMIYGIGFVALAPWLAKKALAAPQLAGLLQISAIAAVLGVINGVQTSALAGVEAFRAISYVTVGGGIAQSVMVVVGAWASGLKGAIIGMAAGMVLTVIGTRWAVSGVWRHFNIRLHWREARQEWRVLVHYSLPTFLTLLLIGPVYWAANAFLANQPNGYAALGIFNAGTQWQGAVQALAAMICTAMIPIMSEQYGSGDVLGSLHMMWRMVRLIAWFVVPTSLLLAVLSPEILKGYGGTFASGYWTMILLVATGALYGIMYPITQFAAASGLMWHGLVFNLGWVVAMLAGSWFMVHWGSEGLAGARLLAQMVQLASYLWFAAVVQRRESRSNIQEPVTREREGR